MWDYSSIWAFTNYVYYMPKLNTYQKLCVFMLHILIYFSPYSYISINFDESSNIMLSLHIFYNLVLQTSWEKVSFAMSVGTISVLFTTTFPRAMPPKIIKPLLPALIHLFLYKLPFYLNLFQNTKWVKVALNDLLATTYSVILK